MAEVKKITIEKNDEPAAIAEALIDAEESEIILSVPKASLFAESVNNFKLVKRQADVLNKHIVVESVDDTVVELAKKTGLEARNPFFGRMEQQRFSDIMVSPKAHKPKVSLKQEEAPPPKKGRPRKGKKAEPEDVAPIVAAPLGAPEAEAREQEPLRPARETNLHEQNEQVVPPPAAARTTLVAGTSAPQEPPSPSSSPAPAPIAGAQHGFFSRATPAHTIVPPLRKKIFRRRTVVILLAIALGFGLFSFLGLTVLPKADIAIFTVKEDFNFSGTLMALKTVATINSEKDQVPGQIFSQQTNATLKFAAHGREQIARKAKGTITIYNAYSSQPQRLVATTRFEAPDGKIFRITEAVTVPGAKIENGKIVPSSIDAPIEADKAGTAYNVSAISRLSIPGFSGSDKYQGFYGEIKSPTTGGFVGEAVVATSEDIAAAKESARKSLEDSAQLLLQTKIPQEFTVLEGATRFEITKQVVNDQADTEGNFSVYTEGAITQIAFRAGDVEALMQTKLAAAKGAQYQVDDADLQYGSVTPDFSAGSLELAVQYTAQVSQKIDIPALTQAVQGKSEEELQQTIGGLPGVSKAEISLWPFWVKRVPQNEQKITITVE